MKVDNSMMAGFYEGFFVAIKLFLASSVFPFFFIFIILSVLIRWKMPVIKGTVGEWKVKSKLRSIGEEYKVFHNIYLPNGEHGLTQVDHIVTSAYGLFVIETKHYSGWIFGDEYKPFWTQVIYRRKSKFYNPIRQNYGHIQALAAYIGKENTADIHSVIAFSSNSTFKFNKKFTTAHVIQFPELLRTISHYKEHRIGEMELKHINDKLTELSSLEKKDKKERKAEHLKKVRQAKKRLSAIPINIAETQKQVATDNPKRCPKCEGYLTLKSGRYGKFYGCSGFPVCRHTEKLG